MNINRDNVPAFWVALSPITELNQTPLVLDIQLKYDGIQILRSAVEPAVGRPERISYVVEEAVDQRGPRV